MSALSLLLLLSLLAHVGAHVVIAVSLARKGEWRRAAGAFFVPPLAPLWGWRAGMRLPVYAWGGTLAFYALGVAVA